MNCALKKNFELNEMLTIITAIYNQLDMNRLYYESIVETTDGDWELIVVDNGSTDG